MDGEGRGTRDGCECESRGVEAVVVGGCGRSFNVVQGRSSQGLGRGRRTGDGQVPTLNLLFKVKGRGRAASSCTSAAR